MIENKLNNLELSMILRPILRLESTPKIISEFEHVFPIKLNSLEDIQNYTIKFLVTYKDFKIFIKGIGNLTENSTYITVDFRIEKKMWHIFKNPTAKVVKDLKKICLKEIEGLSFTKYSTTGYSYPYTADYSDSHTYYHDARSFNNNWREGMGISSILIAPSENEKYYFVEFLFNSNCYTYSDNKIILKDDWEKYIFDIPIHIEKKANELLKNGFKKTTQKSPE